jgi:glycosyltransferase involved in cell wall biosynthesis
MKLLWVYGDFLHPTTRGGQIRTLQTLKRLHSRHEVHYAGLCNPRNAEGPARASEYASHVYPVSHVPPSKTSPAFGLQLVKGLFAPLPVPILRYNSRELRATVDRLRREIPFDHVVCDFLNSAPYFSDLSEVALFQHNVEAVIWERHAENAPTPLHRSYFRLQARRMAAYERKVCTSVKSVIAVSDGDAKKMRDLYGVTRVGSVPTGVDLEFFTPQGQPHSDNDLVFVGSMDWMPNVDGILWFVDEVLPLIRKRQPQCTIAVVGREPGKDVANLAQRDSLIRITGTVPDVRPSLWGAKVAIVPLRIGGGTRLKIYEAMAARVPVVSTTIGAEGLDVSPGENILMGDTPAQFADACLRLLLDDAERRRVAASAWEHVSARHSWEAAATAFERLLTNPRSC